MRCKPFFILGIVISILLSTLSSITFTVGTVKADMNMPTLSLEIHRVQAEDWIEIGWLEDGADFEYTISVWDGEKFITQTNTLEKDRDNVMDIDETHQFQLSRLQGVFVNIFIVLYEMDGQTRDQVADISSNPGLVKGDQSPPAPRGAIFECTYNLKDNSLTGDTVYVEEDYYKTSGNYDGSTDIDENDASLWFKIWDNYTAPVAVAGPDQTVYLGKKANFDGSESKASAGSSIIRYEWDFETDGRIDAEGQTASYTYPKKGTYTVILRVTDSIGETDTDNCTIRVVTPGLPRVDAGPDQVVYVRERVNFDGSGSKAAPGASIERYQWDFETDGFFDAEGIKTSHTYTEKGTFKVTLKVTDNFGETDTDTCTVRVETPKPPVADAGRDQKVDVGDRVNFDGSGSYAYSPASIVRYQWDFQNDGVFDVEGEHIFYTYTTEGTYTVLLKVTDSFGQTGTNTCTITVINPPPSASFTYSPSEPTILHTVHFYDTSTDDGTIVSWNWDFGDGATSTHKDPTHNYTDKGSYAVTLTVTDDDGASNSITKEVIILNLLPNASFTYSPSSPKEGENIQFLDRSTDPEGKTLKYLWDFGDGFTSTQQNPTHQYATSGMKRVSLTVTDDEDAAHSISKTITVRENIPPAPDFAFPDNLLVNTDVQFTDDSKDPDGVITSWSWDFGDGSTSTQQNPTHRYKTAGNYIVTLTVEDDGGKSDQKIKTIEIIPVYDLSIEVKDLFGFSVSNAEVELYSNGVCCASGHTDSEGKITLPEIPRGNYQIRVTSFGQTTSIEVSLAESKTEQIRVTLSIYTVSIGGAATVVLVGIVIYAFRRRQGGKPAEPTAEPRSNEKAKLELEKERITEMLASFKEKYEDGELDEQSYEKLRSKYQKKIDDIERELTKQ